MADAIFNGFLRVLFSEPDENGELDALSSADWEAIADVAGQLVATGMLASRLKERGKLSIVPRKVRDRLLVAYRNNTAHALMLSHELDELIRDFEAAAVAVAPLKGGSLLRHGIYRDTGARFFNDLDILTRPKDRDCIDAILRRRGFVCAGEGESPKHLPPYRRGNILLEVHEFAYWEPNGARIDLDRWLVQGPLLASTIAHLLHHVFISSVRDPVLLLKSLWDLRELSRAGNVPWGDAELLAARAGLGDELDAMRAAAVGADRDAQLFSMCAPGSKQEMQQRELEFTARILLRSPLWYRAVHAWSILVPRPPRSLGDGARLAARPFKLTAEALSRVARKKIAKAPNG